MIEILEGFPDNVVAVAASGRVTKQDYTATLTPKVLQMAAAHQKLRCYYELGPEFSGMAPGAILEDLRIGMKYRSHWERVAVVTNAGWVRIAVNAFRFMIPGEIRVYPISRAGEAKVWLSL